MSACNNFENYWQNLNLVWQKHYWITDKVRQWSDLGLIKSNRQKTGRRYDNENDDGDGDDVNHDTDDDYFAR